MQIMKASTIQFGMNRTQKNVGKMAMAAFALGAAGCSPQTQSYITGKYTELPPPPASSRMVVNMSSENENNFLRTSITWNQDKNAFTLRDIHYSTTTIHPGTFFEQGGYEQPIRDQEVFAGGVIVDQVNKKLLLPNGKKVDGPTGTIN